MNGHQKQRILIVKTGQTELLEAYREQQDISIGDVLRSTSLLHLFKNEQICWLTSKKSMSLLKDNPYLNHIFLEEEFENITPQFFDLIIYLEKSPDLASKIQNKFKYSKWIDLSQKNPHFKEGLNIIKNPLLKKENTSSYQKILFRALGKSWNGEKYVLRKPHRHPEHDIGLNWKVGPKWPTKSWDLNSWKKLENLLSPSYKVSWQEGFENLQEYLSWISSCRTLITCDSLGMHIAHAYNIKTFSIFGPTNELEIEKSNRSINITSNLDLDCRKCYLPACPIQQECMTSITPEDVYRIYADDKIKNPC